MVSITTNEVFLSWFSFSKNAFEAIVKASSNSDRLVFFACALDLDSDIAYNLQIENVILLFVNKKSYLK